MPQLSSPYDRKLLTLAIPAFLTLASESTYLLFDTAMVGQLGEHPLAVLAVSASMIGVLLGLAVVATSAITATVSRLHGAQEDDLVRVFAAQTIWLGCAVGLLCLALSFFVGGQWANLVGAQGQVAIDSATYLKITGVGMFWAVFSMAAQGWMRGVGQLKSAFRIVLVGNLLNVLLNPLFIYGFGWGLWGSAIATSTGQTVMGVCFALILWRRSLGISRRPVANLQSKLASASGMLLIRMTALLLSFSFATALCGRISESALAAHQIGWQLFLFIALGLDAIAVAGQILIGQDLGGGNRQGAITAAGRMTIWSGLFGLLLAVLMLTAREPILSLFSHDDAVLEQARAMWPLFCLLLPLGAMTFAFDGVLIGSGDLKYLALAMCAATALALPTMYLAYGAGWGIKGVWLGLDVFIFGRFLWMGLRTLNKGWASEGAWRAGT